MITLVRLENWRAYRSFELKLDTGTTFLVASNGVGKTSLIDAVRWALDRSKPAVASMLRDGSSTASVEVEINAGPSSVRIKRSLQKGRGRNPKVTIETWAEGRSVDENEAFELLATHWGADNEFVARAAFITDRLLYANEEPDLRAHLRSVFGLDRLQDAIDQLVPAITEAKRATESARTRVRGTEAELATAKSAVESTAVALNIATARETELRIAATAAFQALEAARRAVEASEQHAAWQTEHDAIVSEILPIVGEVPADASLQLVLRSAEAAARQQLEQLREDRALVLGRVAAVDDALTRLREAGGDCPVCRRPLDDESRRNAEHQHERDHRTAYAQLEAIDLEGPSTVAATLRELSRRADQLGDAPERPGAVPSDVADFELRARLASEALEAAVADVREAEIRYTESLTARDELTAALETQSEVPRLFRRHGTLEAARTALERTITEVLGTELGPVSAEVNRRWDALFSDRPGLRFSPNGDIVRPLEDTDLEFASFSSGEQMVAKLLLRLSTLIKTTKVPFFWIDEPLEHLDPDARRFVAQTLASLSKFDSLGQIFVTTYEEPLASKLAERDREHVHLEYLRTAIALS